MCHARQRMGDGERGMKWQKQKIEKLLFSIGMGLMLAFTGVAIVMTAYFFQLDGVHPDVLFNAGIDVFGVAVCAVMYYGCLGDEESEREGGTHPVLHHADPVVRRVLHPKPVYLVCGLHPELSGLVCGCHRHRQQRGCAASCSSRRPSSARPLPGGRSWWRPPLW